MATLAETVTKLARRFDQRIDSLGGSFEVATTSPFTVYLNGQTTAVPALKVAGLSYSVGTTGIYQLRQGQKPVCWPTTA